MGTVCETSIHLSEDESVVRMREFATRICRDYLKGAWKTVGPQDIGFKRISGGLSNLLYHVTLPAHLNATPTSLDGAASGRGDTINSTVATPPMHLISSSHRSHNSSGRNVVGVASEADDAAPGEVLIRLYGQMHGERALEALITESVIFTLLSERGLGPKLHGVFPGGRIEQYIRARPLTTSELRDGHLSTLIAHKMAAIHTMQVPLHKDPGWLWQTIERWLQTCEKKYCAAHAPPPTQLLAYMRDGRLRTEAHWLRTRLNQAHSPVVFCHNDMQEGNILIRMDDEESDSCDTVDNNNVKDVVLIDFEYCSYNYRAFDIANHFLEWTYDYTASAAPYFTHTAANYPNTQQRLHFIEAYLRTVESGGGGFVDDGGPSPFARITEAHKILHEVEVFSLASHLIWGLWGIINADTSKIPFGYLDYAASRLEQYFQLKASLSKHSQCKRKVDTLE